MMDARIQKIADDVRLKTDYDMTQELQAAGRILAEISKDTGCQCASCVKTKTVMAVAILTAVGIKP